MKLVNSKKDVLTIPNALSLFRFILAGVFLWMYYAAEIENKRYRLTGVLLLSAVTDFLDGKVFAGCESIQLNPLPEDVAGFNEYMERYRRYLPVEQEAVSL